MFVKNKLRAEVKISRISEALRTFYELIKFFFTLSTFTYTATREKLEHLEYFTEVFEMIFIQKKPKRYSKLA